MKIASIRGRLLLLVLGPLLILLTVASILAYRFAFDTAAAAYDRALLDPALALAKYVDPKSSNLNSIDWQQRVPEVVVDALRIDTEDKIFYRLIAPDGRTLAGNAQLGSPAAIPKEMPHVFFDTTHAGEQLRAVALPVATEAGALTIVVGETLVKRRALVREVIFGMIAPELAVMVAALALVLFAVHRGLIPLEQLRSEIGARSPSDLRPVGEQGAPDEVRPLVRALNELLARLRGALDSQAQFIGNAAHQLRTPLAGLSAHAELALREPATGELRRLLVTLHGETQRTAHLVNQLLALARAEPAAGEHAERALVNLEKVVSESASPFIHRALEREIDLGFDLAPAWTMGEPLLLRELAANLLDNAIRYTPRGSTITVRTGEESESAVLRVEDNGPGIPEQFRDQVMQRFFRLPSASGDGCGLGLAIVADIAARHGARVCLAEGPGDLGVDARVYFPRSRAPQTAIDASALDQL